MKELQDRDKNEYNTSFLFIDSKKNGVQFLFQI